MRKLFLIPVFLLVSELYCFAAGNYSNEWQKGAAFYEQKQYDSAAWYYEQIATLKPHNAEVYYNLGNAYYRLNKIAPAVLNYERALKINPDYTAAKENLALTQSRISNAIQAAGNIFFINWWHDITRTDKATAWDILALSAFTLMFVSLLLRRFQKTGGSRIPMQLPGFLFFIFLGFLALAYAASNNINPHTAVVMQTDAPLMNGELKGKPLVLIPEGTTVTIKSENGSWPRYPFLMAAQAGSRKA